MAEPRVLVSWHESPDYIPAPVFSSRQLTVGPRRSDQPEDIYEIVTPIGMYDLHDHLSRHGVDTAFDLVVVSADAVRRNLPVNLAAFGCPVVLIAGDTHHLDQPLQIMLAYARAEPFDLVVNCHNRHHLHWYVEAGLRRVLWLPGGIARHIPVRPPERRRPTIAFVGQSGPFHPRRTRLLERLQESGLPLRGGRASRVDAASLYAGSQLSFNASLNADLNMRVFEVLSGQGCLLTDRLAPASGLDLLLEEGRDYLAYGSEEEMIEQARAALADPARCAAIAASGYRRFMAELQPDMQIARLMGWVGGAPVDALHEARDDPRMARGTGIGKLTGRVRNYERVQEKHRVIERPVVEIDARVPVPFMLDLADLPRLLIRIAPDADEARAAAPQARALGAQVVVADAAPA